MPGFATPSDYYDRLWEPAPESRPDPATVDFVRGLGPVERALDLGCGDGVLTAELRAEDVTAADVSLVALKRARRRLTEGVTLIMLMADQPLPFDDDTFDLVLCADTVPYVKDLFNLVLELRRVLVPGGQIAITTPAHRRADGLSLAARGFERRFDPAAPEMRFFTERSLGELLDSGGFAPIYIRRRGGTLLATADR